MESTLEDQLYKQQQEKFISNHSGSTCREIILTILPSICATFLASTTVNLVGKYVNRNILTFFEFLIIILPCILGCTVFSEHPNTISITMLTISCINLLLILRNSMEKSFNHNVVTKKRIFLTNFRALTNIVTAICILAVDFPIFPRKFVKTEIYGYSLMDIGVGLFIIANSLVAPETRDFHEDKKSTLVEKLWESVKKSLRSSGILLLLGFSRFIAVELSDYQRHVTEYGVHWNFFMTLAFVKLFTGILSTIQSPKYSVLSGICIIALHEYILTGKGVKTWVLGDSERDTFISANREGILSIPGYVGLYFIGIGVGRLINSTYNTIPNDFHEKIAVKVKFLRREFTFEYNKSMILCIKLSLITPNACIVSILCEMYFGVSRRLANSTYCIWVVTLSTAMLTLLLLIEIIIEIVVFPSKSMENKSKSNLIDHRNTENSCKNTQNIFYPSMESLEIFEAVNYNGLMFFLVSNLMTGIVNKCVQTLYVIDELAILILIFYMALGIFLTVFCYRKKIQVKF